MKDFFIYSTDAKTYEKLFCTPNVERIHIVGGGGHVTLAFRIMSYAYAKDIELVIHDIKSAGMYYTTYNGRLNIIATTAEVHPMQCWFNGNRLMYDLEFANIEIEEFKIFISQYNQEGCFDPVKVLALVENSYYLGLALRRVGGEEDNVSGYLADSYRTLSLDSFYFKRYSGFTDFYLTLVKDPHLDSIIAYLNKK